MLSFDDTLADAFHGPLIERAVEDVLAARGSRARVKAIVARVAHLSRQRGATELASDLYGVEKAAAMLGVSERRVRALAESREVGAKLGRNTWAFRAVDIEAMRDRNPGRPRTPKEAPDAD